MAGTGRARYDSGALFTHTAEQADAVRRTTEGGASGVGWEEQDEVEWRAMKDVLAVMEEEMQLEVEEFQNVELERRNLQRERRRHEAMARKMRGKLDMGSRWAQFLGDRLQKGEEANVRALRDQVVRRSDGWRSALGEAEVEARLAWRWTEVVELKEKELQGRVDKMHEDVRELREVVAEATCVRDANQGRWVAAVVGTGRVVAGGARRPEMEELERGGWWAEELEELEELLELACARGVATAGAGEVAAGARTGSAAAKGARSSTRAASNAAGAREAAAAGAEAAAASARAGCAAAKGENSTGAANDAARARGAAAVGAGAAAAGARTGGAAAKRASTTGPASNAAGVAAAGRKGDNAKERRRKRRAAERAAAEAEGGIGALGGGTADGGAVLLAKLLTDEGGEEKGELTGRSVCRRDQNRVWDPGGR